MNNPTSLLSVVDARLGSLRENAARRRGALVVAVLAGLALSWVHWLGLVGGGAFVGLTRRNTPRAVLAGLGFGALAVAVGVLVTPTLGPTEFAGLLRIAGLSTGIALVLSAWGSLLRAAV